MQSSGIKLFPKCVTKPMVFENLVANFLMETMLGTLGYWASRQPWLSCDQRGNGYKLIFGIGLVLPEPIWKMGRVVQSDHLPNILRSFFKVCTNFVGFKFRMYCT